MCVCMYVCVCACMYVYVCMYVRMYKSLCVCVHIYVCVSMRVQMCVCTCVCFTQLWIRISLHKHDLLGFSSAAFFPRTENQIRGYKGGVSRQCSHPLGTSSALSDLHLPNDCCTWPHSTGLSLGETACFCPGEMQQCGALRERVCVCMCMCACGVCSTDFS